MSFITPLVPFAERRIIRMNSVLRAFIPVYGASTRFRLYLRLREFYRKHNMDFLATCLKVHLQKNYGCELSIHAEISPKAAFMHTVGIVIGEGVVVEDGVVFYSGVVLGRKNINDSNDYPTIKKMSYYPLDVHALVNVS